MAGRRFGRETFWQGDVLVGRRFGRETFWQGDVLAGRRFGRETFRLESQFLTLPVERQRVKCG